MELKNSSFEQVRDYYAKASAWLDLNQNDKAVKVLYEEMSIELYDLSLDILFNRNALPPTKSMSKLRELIKQVDSKLNPVEIEEESDLEDEYEFF